MKTSLASILSKTSQQATPGGTGSGLPVWRSSTSVSWRKHPLSAADAGESRQTPPTPVGEGEMPKLEFSDLDWESKENILRLLFAKMNGLVGDEPPPGMVTPQPETNAAAPESGGSSVGGDLEDRALVFIEAGNAPAPVGNRIVELTDDDDTPAPGPERDPGGLSLTEVAA
ncbi:MAG: hypothetical protein BJ554DRAFT_1482 [Olpidium bornovanus]|uniref:Uncharacterized protein n=1 Tax=Olpidium bornovanus TaxID=278681 RepID=A0A8H7ZSC4_9FUNG|nr:MAG: hypothetical protein BJ554DRAFT_1482 [Olpidium bornovanus]